MCTDCIYQTIAGDCTPSRHVPYALCEVVDFILELKLANTRIVLLDLRHLTHFEVGMIDYRAPGCQVHGANYLNGTGKHGIAFCIQFNPLEHALQVVRRMIVPCGKVLLAYILQVMYNIVI